jgi:hypothetical protein
MFDRADHLPSRGVTDPHEHLPRQRKGTTPQMHGRYPDFDVLAEAEHWDEVTRRLVLGRVHDVPPYRFFSEHEREALEAFCDTLLAQDAEPRIPVLAYIDAKLYADERDGYRYDDLPPDRDLWRLVARGIDDEARALGLESFAELSRHHRDFVAHRFAKGELREGVWAELNLDHAFSVVMRDVCQAFYAHPWSWNEIGFGGPAYPRGYAAFGNPELGEREHWEGEEAFSRDPVPDVEEKGWD